MGGESHHRGFFFSFYLSYSLNAPQTSSELERFPGPHSSYRENRHGALTPEEVLQEKLTDQARIRKNIFLKMKAHA